MYFTASAHRQPLDLDADRKQDTLKLADPSQHCVPSLPSQRYEGTLTYF